MSLCGHGAWLAMLGLWIPPVLIGTWRRYHHQLQPRWTVPCNATYLRSASEEILRSSRTPLYHDIAFVRKPLFRTEGAHGRWHPYSDPWRLVTGRRPFRIFQA
ncbi:uncharacterized protein EV420DRAFT_243036 [Desarmillaria tabescens]|uniref:Uncharacterized protein n=1 Tax=Armillaria tabescens TaxID=1929756 RepID=A0AA39KH75_ARMTA|nr:uncharacterized protein EV420DRAFT_243036 [Desarmillaria tabescens]KAK0459960.1 hypothetical protein EV420DRAFT_243036 [Desarmillaria tabescens]